MQSDGPLLAEVRIASFEDVVAARQAVREVMNAMGFNLLDQTRIVTAASDLARNIIVGSHAGAMRVFESAKPGAGGKGIVCVFEEDREAASDRKGSATDDARPAGTPGVDLTGAKRMCDEFQISSIAGKGAAVTIAKWL